MREHIPLQASQNRISWSYEPVTSITDISAPCRVADEDGRAGIDVRWHDSGARVPREERSEIELRNSAEFPRISSPFAEVHFILPCSHTKMTLLLRFEGVTLACSFFSYDILWQCTATDPIQVAGRYLDLGYHSVHAHFNCRWY